MRKRDESLNLNRGTICTPVQMITETGNKRALRLQFSVYEMNNTKRLMDNVKIKIETIYAKQFSGADSVMIFDVNNSNIIKYGNAIHRDTDAVYF
ncbi:MAG: hypothetical protein PHR20_06970 [Bacteroidales bacterium]|nr:hypothetical protein [Bacteroidales bacterium]